VSAWGGEAIPEAAPRNPKLLDRVRDAIRLKHYSIRTEKIYCDWIRRFILFHGKRHPTELHETLSGLILGLFS